MLLDLKQVAERLSVHYDTAYAFVVSGKLQGVRLGGQRKWQVTEKDLLAFIESSKVGPFAGPQSLPDRPKVSYSNRTKKALKPAPHQWRQAYRAK